jgi:3-oxoacyl-[acyl-carrier protein] reductase
VDFTDRVAVVTGGASGIGEATCRMLAEHGARVAVLDINRAGGERVARDLPKGVSIPCDVTDSGAVDAAFEDLARTLGPVSVLVNSAGPVGDDTTKTTLTRQAKAAVDPLSTPTAIMSDEEWLGELKVVLFAVFYCTRAALRQMLPRGAGAIVNVSSIHGIAGGTGLPHYSAGKAGIHGFTRSVAKEVAPFGVRINTVAPGYVDTPILQRLMPPDMQATIARGTPLGRLGRSEEQAAAICFLTSDDASFITGQTLSPNGGFLTV